MARLSITTALRHPQVQQQDLFVTVVADPSGPSLQFATSYIIWRDISYGAHSLRVSVHWQVHLTGQGHFTWWVTLRHARAQPGLHGLDGFADSYWGNSISRRSAIDFLAQYNKAIIFLRSEIHRRYEMQKTVSPSGGGGVRLGIQQFGHRGPVASQPSREHGFPAIRWDSSLRGLKHAWTGWVNYFIGTGLRACKAHWNLHAIC